jgi:hypothetical protein
VGEFTLLGEHMKDIKTKLQSVLDNGHSGETVTIYGEQYNTHELAKEHGIELPKAKKAKKQVNITEDIQEEEHADMGEPSDKGHTE